MGKRVTNLSQDDIRRLHDLVNPSGELEGKKYGGISRAAKHFKVSRGTIHNWLKAYPERPRDEEDHNEALNAISSALDQAKYALRDVKRYFGYSVVIDLLELKMNREFLDESVEQQRQRVLETVANGGKDKSSVEERLEDLEKAVNKAEITLKQYRWKVNNR